LDELASNFSRSWSACLGGRMIAQKISVKNITLLGGVVFILFAIHGFYQIFGVQQE